MAKARNIVLLCIAALIICGSLLTRVLVHFDVSFPEETGIGQTWRALEGREVSATPQFSLASFESGEFQDAVESYASDALPFHDQAMLLNAGLQEVGISQAAGLFGFDVYPTYLASNRLYIASQDAVTYLPFEHTEYHDQKLTEYAQGLAKQAKAHPDKKFVVYMVQGFAEPSVNPANSLVGNVFLPQDEIAVFKAALGDCPNVSVLTDSYSTLDEYYQDFFHSDHHWNARGALRAYNTIAAELGLEQVDTSTLTLRQVCSDVTFMGATSRWGRHVVNDAVMDVNIDYSGVSYKRGGKTLDGNDHSSYEALSGDKKVYSFYDEYYDNIPQGVITGQGSGSALLISNSYGGAIQRQLATQYATLYKSTAMKAGHEDETLSGLIEKSGADTIIFVANPTDFMTAAAVLPNFFD